MYTKQSSRKLNVKVIVKQQNFSFYIECCISQLTLYCLLQTVRLLSKYSSEDISVVTDLNSVHFHQYPTQTVTQTQTQVLGTSWRYVCAHALLHSPCWCCCSLLPPSLHNLATTPACAGMPTENWELHWDRSHKTPPHCTKQAIGQWQGMGFFKHKVW